MYYDTVERMEIYQIDVKNTYGSVLKGERPAIVISNKFCNEFSTSITMALITKLAHKTNKCQPTHVKLNGYGLKHESVILCEQQLTVNKKDILFKIGKVDKPIMQQINRALNVQNDLFDVDFAKRLVTGIKHIDKMIYKYGELPELQLQRAFQINTLKTYLDNYGFDETNREKFLQRHLFSETCYKDYVYNKLREELKISG